ncbi:MAG: tetratricopeptide repeat protein [Crocinitomicaceae bacterium]|nr:tetratricopeptide repeat protein [Flavobacteriales bacterium]NQZ34513.1 tetratricopeptide repeat protein [Crocinitomicaceae bacterium]
MKHFIIVLLGIVLSTPTFAQPNKVVTAKLKYEDGKLIDAINIIDQAILHDKSKNNAGAWELRGDIYGALATSNNDKADITAEAIYNAIAESYVRVDQIKEGNDISKMQRSCRLYGSMALNEGVEKFNVKDYSSARSLFLSAISLGEINNFTDSLAIYNVALASERLEDYSTAANYYSKCLKIGYRPETMYFFLADSYKQLGDETSYKKTLREGLEKYPNNSSLITSILNLKLSNGDFEGALNDLNKLVELDPKNAMLHFSLGSTLDNLKMSDDAIASYKKAIELDPSYFDPQYNLAALYFNRGVELNNATNEIQDAATYEKKMNEVNLIFLEAQKQLEKAHEVKPEDINTLSSLKQCYARMNDAEGYERVSDKLKSLGY